MLTSLTSSAASAALAVIIVVSPPGGGQPGGAPPSPGVPARPAAGATTAAGSPALSPAAAGSGGAAGYDWASTPCTTQVRDASGLQQAMSAGGGHVCVDGALGTRLTVKNGGTAQQPLVISGGGRAVVKGITVEANNVVIDGFQVLGAQAPGIELTGNRIAASNNYVKHPTGGDFDGVRFFGDDLRIEHNTITDISPDGGGAHADCMQTFTSGGGPPTNHLVVNANRCDNIDNQCLMAEGPGDVGDGGGGPGKSTDWLITNNYCSFGAGQALMIEAIQGVKIANNEFKGTADKAIGLDINSTGAKVSANKLVGIKAAVGMSEDSRGGYQGPEPQGGP